MNDMKFQTGLSFASVYMKNSYRGGRKILVSKVAFTRDLIWKMTNLKFQIDLSFASLYSHIGTAWKFL